MRFSFIILLVLFCTANVRAKDPEFSFSYPDSLAKNANAIVLLDESVFVRSSKSDMKEQVHYVVTILSDRGDNHAEFSLPYDKFTTISGLECTLYDSNGKKIRKVKSSEIRDYSAYDGFSLFSDNRLKYFKALNSTYPYTIDLSCELTFKGFIGIPTWYAMNGYNVGVKKSEVIVKYPSAFPINYKEKNIGNIARREFTEGNLTCVSWAAENISPIEYERFSPPSTESSLPKVLFAPLTFCFEKSEGTFKDWQSYGLWRYGLLYNEYSLTEKTKAELLKMKERSANERELCQQIYKYVQSKTRYVSVQEGIGGVKPIDPKIVDEVGYGDCKALSSYTKTLLDFVGIRSYFTLIGSGNTTIEFLDFPNKNQTNHAILCVPMPQDTIWLECTSQTAPFNHLFSGTTGRKALLVNEEGGKIVTTPEPFENRQKNLARVNVNPNGGILCEMATQSTGSFYDDEFGKLQLSDKELREELLDESPVSDISIVSAKVSQKAEIPELTVDKSFSTRNFVTKSGNRMFVELSPFMSLSRVVPQKSARRNPVYLEEASVFEDQVTLKLPEGYTLEFCPEGKTIESEFGHYQSAIQSAGDSVIFHRTLTINKANYPKERYTDFVGFINNTADADKCKIILKM